MKKKHTIQVNDKMYLTLLLIIDEDAIIYICVKYIFHNFLIPVHCLLPIISGISNLVAIDNSW